MKFRELLTLRRASNLRISPNGSKCAFLVHTPRQVENDYEPCVYISDYTSTSPLGAPGVASFAWLDENSLLAARPEGKSTAFFQLSLIDGSESPYDFVPFESSIEGFIGGELLISARRPITEEKAQEDGAWSVLDELPMWEDGFGYRAKICRKLFLCAGGSQPRCISPEAMDVRLVSADHRRVVYAGCTPDVLVGGADEIRCWDGADRPVCKDSEEIIQLALGENAIFFAALARDSEAGAALALMHVPLAGGAPELLCASGLAVGNYIVSDAGLCGSVFVADGDTLYFVATVKGASQLYKLAPDSTPQCLTTAPGSIDLLDVHAGRTVFAGLRGTARHEVYYLQDSERKLSALHGPTDTLYRSMQSIACEGACGWAIRRQETAEKSCASVLFLHDGPQQAFGEAYHFGMQLLAQKGYVVLFANLPGSIGYGNDFAALGGRWGEDDHDALIRFLDAALTACPEADPARLGVIGTGYGGYLAATATGKTDRFAAAICDGVISNCISMEATSDHGVAFATQQMKASGYKQPEELWRRSPLSRIASIKTPTLVLHGEVDRRSHLSQGQMLFTSLKVHSVPTRMCIFRGESHDYAVVGTPASRDRYHAEILRWLELYL